eukprot:Hpha_TRINITY_DN14945_c0_g3::TRINITY_DN14945_c0_g3_i7::g.144770::m.144770
MEKSREDGAEATPKRAPNGGACGEGSPVPHTIYEMLVPVVGRQHYTRVEVPPIGTVLHFKRDRVVGQDANAVRCEDASGNLLGFMMRRQVEFVAPLMDNGLVTLSAAVRHRGNDRFFSAKVQFTCPYEKPMADELVGKPLRLANREAYPLKRADPIPAPAMNNASTHRELGARVGLPPTPNPCRVPLPSTPDAPRAAPAPNSPTPPPGVSRTLIVGSPHAPPGEEVTKSPPAPPAQPRVAKVAKGPSAPGTPPAASRAKVASSPPAQQAAAKSPPAEGGHTPPPKRRRGAEESDPLASAPRENLRSVKEVTPLLVDMILARNTSNVMRNKSGGWVLDAMEFPVALGYKAVSVQAWVKARRHMLQRPDGKPRITEPDMGHTMDHKLLCAATALYASGWVAGHPGGSTYKPLAPGQVPDEPGDPEKSLGFMLTSTSWVLVGDKWTQVLSASPDFLLYDTVGNLRGAMCFKRCLPFRDRSPPEFLLRGLRVPEIIQLQGILSLLADIEYVDYMVCSDSRVALWRVRRSPELISWAVPKLLQCYCWVTSGEVPTDVPERFDPLPQSILWDASFVTPLVPPLKIDGKWAVPDESSHLYKYFEDTVSAAAAAMVAGLVVLSTADVTSSQGVRARATRITDAATAAALQVSAIMTGELLDQSPERKAALARSAVAGALANIAAVMVLHVDPHRLERIIAELIPPAPRRSKDETMSPEELLGGREGFEDLLRDLRIDPLSQEESFGFDPLSDPLGSPPGHDPLGGAPSPTGQPDLSAFAGIQEYSSQDPDAVLSRSLDLTVDPIDPLEEIRPGRQGRGGSPGLLTRHIPVPWSLGEEEGEPMDVDFQQTTLSQESQEEVPI